jgi:hypothetical protein
VKASPANPVTLNRVKKTAVILLLLIYGSATMGATVHLHYCMNQFVSWSLFHSKDDKCGKCGMTEKDKAGCCKDEHQHFKLKDDQRKTNASQLVSFIAAPVLLVPAVDFDIHTYSTYTERYPTSHAPPDINRKRLHILNGVFLI